MGYKITNDASIPLNQPVKIVWFESPFNSNIAETNNISWDPIYFRAFILVLFRFGFAQISVHPHNISGVWTITHPLFQIRTLRTGGLGFKTWWVWRSDLKTVCQPLQLQLQDACRLVVIGTCILQKSCLFLYTQHEKYSRRVCATLCYSQITTNSRLEEAQ